MLYLKNLYFKKKEIFTFWIINYKRIFSFFQDIITISFTKYGSTNSSCKNAFTRHSLKWTWVANIITENEIESRIHELIFLSFTINWWSYRKSYRWKGLTIKLADLVVLISIPIKSYGSICSNNWSTRSTIILILGISFIIITNIFRTITYNFFYI